jgi:hypothetical protein
MDCHFQFILTDLVGNDDLVQASLLRRMKHGISLAPLSWS